MPTLRLGTRASALALTQSEMVAASLRALGWAVELVPVRTVGDEVRAPLRTIGGTGVFVTALRDALLADACDIAVHSLKDLPTTPADGIALVAVPQREDPRDVLCARSGRTLADLPAGARVGTGSPRRAAQLHLVRPDVEVVDIRGNVDTRLGRLARDPGDPAALDAVVLARAGLARLGRLDAVTETFAPEVMMPAPGQGALAVECRSADADRLRQAGLATLDDPGTRLAVAAERAFLARLGAGCSAPVGAFGRLGVGRPRTPALDVLALDALAIDADGHAVRAHARRPAVTTDAAHDLGRSLADEVLARGLGTPTALDPTTPRRPDA